MSTVTNRTSLLRSQAGPANHVVDAIRKQVAVRKEVLDEAKRRRDLVRELAKGHEAARGTYNSGSVAHGTANAPLEDADGGVVLDRRKFPRFGPDGVGLGPESVMNSFLEWILPQLSDDYPNVTGKPTKRALLFEFGQVVEFEGEIKVDPSVDLIVALDRRDAPGLWIPNRETAGWDASHPQRHTQLFVSTAQDLRVHRARVVRLAKIAVKNDDERRVMCSFNISALALKHVVEVAPIAPALALFLLAAADDIAVQLTPDPAEVSGSIRLPEGINQTIASHRLREMGVAITESLRAENEAEARRILEAVYGRQIGDIRDGERRKITNALDARDGAAISGLLGTHREQKSRRSYGG